jgi:LacI family transcriptional regulator
VDSITLKDIASALNLSASTVSRALRDSYQINEKTKKLVLEYAQSVNYRPNPIAQSLKSSRSKAIGVIVPEIANNFFSQAINGIEDEAYSRGYHVVIFQSHESLEREKMNIQQLFDRKIDGLLISLAGQTTDVKHITTFSERNFPVVYFDRVPDLPNIHKVTSDNFEGAYQATSFLIEKGKTKIAHITSPSNLSITKERLAGYKKALIDHGIWVDENLIKYCGFEKKDAENTVRKLLIEYNPDAFFFCSDRLALNSFEAIKSGDLPSTSNLLFVGYTNLDVAHLFNPPLNTVVQPAYNIGLSAARILCNELEKKYKNGFVEVLELKSKLCINI